MQHLETMRSAAGPRFTRGLDDSWIAKFLVRDPRLGEAITKAYAIWQQTDPELYETEEQGCVQKLQKKFCSLYPDETRQPYIPLAAQGPWIVTLHGSVVHDSGGYGMLTLGHGPKQVLKALSEDVVQANVMTASLAQMKLSDALDKELGRSRKNGNPFESYVMLNSGSEGNSFVNRIIDVKTGHLAGDRKVKALVVQGSFHGRTFRAALLTDTTESAYDNNKCYMINQVIKDYKLTVPQNDCAALRKVYEEAERDGVYIESMYCEGVMGEGRPGMKLDPQFYKLARELCDKHGSMLVVDSVQAGLRTTGNLSIVDFPGFTELPPPDFEVWAKAINAGQYPMSLIAMAASGAEWYRHGIYGNTMTGNPRACLVAAAVLEQVTPALRKNIVEMGNYVVEQYRALQREFPDAIVDVQGTGLLYAVTLNPDRLTVVATDGAEMWLRRNGVNVIHGGTNALRFTPNLNVTQPEIDMQVSHVRQFLVQTMGALERLPSLKKLDSSRGLEPEASSVCALRVTGHLFDTQFINHVLDLAEQEHAKAIVHNVIVGRDRDEQSVATLQVYADLPQVLQNLVAKVAERCGQDQVQLAVLTDGYELAKTTAQDWVTRQSKL